MNELSQKDDAKVRYVYKSEFMTDNKDAKTIDINNFNPDDDMKTESLLIYHISYNNYKKFKAFKSIFHSFV